MIRFTAVYNIIIAVCTTKQKQWVVFVAQFILSIDRITKSKNNIEIIISIIVLIFVDWAILRHSSGLVVV